MGKEKCKGLVGLHNFSGADWGGKFAGIGKLTWIKSYLALDGDDPIIKSFQTMGETPLSDDQNNIPMELKKDGNYLGRQRWKVKSYLLRSVLSFHIFNGQRIPQ